MDKLFIACVMFFIIDLTFVGITCYHVVKYLRRIMINLEIINQQMPKIGQVDRNFIETGEIK